MSQHVKIEGGKEFRAALKAADSDLPKAVRLVNNDAANLVIDAARPDIPSKSGKARRSLRAASTRTSSRVSGGGRPAPYYAWLDFGGRVGRRKSVKRRFIKDGRYIYYQFYRLRDSGKFQDVMAQGYAEVLRKAGIEVSEGGGGQ